MSKLIGVEKKESLGAKDIINIDWFNKKSIQ